MKNEEYIKLIPVKFRKLVSAAVSSYRATLRFEHWDIKIAYMHEEKEFTRADSVTMASCIADPRYLKATIEIYPNLVEKWRAKQFNNEEVCRIIAHEVCHIVTQQFIDLAQAVYKDEGEMKDAWESLTTTIGRLVYRLERSKG